MLASPYDSPDYWSLVRRVRDIHRAGDDSGDDSGVPRLVVADWLEERGESDRAYLIREMSEWHHAMLPGEWHTYFGRVFVADDGRLAFVHNDDCRLLDPSCAALSERYWRGGFLDRVSCPLDWWLAHGPDLCRRHPVRGVTVTDAVGHIGARVHASYTVGRFLVRGRIPGTQDDNEYQSDADAVSALNAHALRWAESEADRTPGDPP